MFRGCTGNTDGEGKVTGETNYTSSLRNVQLPQRIYVAGLWLSNYRQLLKRPKYILGWDFKRDEAEDVVYDWLKSVKKY